MLISLLLPFLLIVLCVQVASRPKHIFLQLHILISWPNNPEISMMILVSPLNSIYSKDHGQCPHILTIFKELLVWGVANYCDKIYSQNFLKTENRLNLWNPDDFSFVDVTGKYLSNREGYYYPTQVCWTGYVAIVTWSCDTNNISISIMFFYE